MDTLFTYISHIIVSSQFFDFCIDFVILRVSLGYILNSSRQASGFDIVGSAFACARHNICEKFVSWWANVFGD